MCSKTKYVINLKEIEDNFMQAVDFVGTDTKVSAVVKSNAYGLGAIPVSKILYDAGCRHFWTAYISEAIELRESLPEDVEIFYLQGYKKQHERYIIRYRLIPVINDALEFSGLKGSFPVVVHIDTGMTRLGVREENLDIILANIEKVDVKYIMSHLACSDDPKHKKNKEQKNKFDTILQKIRAIKHVKATLSATGGMYLGEEYHYDMVRLGAHLYGIKLSDLLPPKKVLTIHTDSLQEYDVCSGTTFGYGATYQTDKHISVSVASIGYADGLMEKNAKSYTDIMQASVNYKDSTILGRISMDLIVVKR